MRRLFVLLAVIGFAVAVAPTAPSKPAAAWIKITTLSGTGDRVVSARLPNGPLVFVASNTGSSNFIVEMRGPNGEDTLVNEIGPWSGATVGDTKSGRHRFAVQAEGAWKIHISRPSTAGLKRLPGAFAGNGSTVIRVRSPRDTELIATASNKGDSNFVVYLVGYGSLSGQDLVFNEIGPYKGQKLVDVPAGPMLLWVDAVGPWTLKFAP